MNLVSYFKVQVLSIHQTRTHTTQNKMLIANVLFFLFSLIECIALKTITHHVNNELKERSDKCDVSKKNVSSSYSITNFCLLSLNILSAIHNCFRCEKEKKVNIFL